jgi:hypothetical protein
LVFCLLSAVVFFLFQKQEETLYETQKNLCPLECCQTREERGRGRRGRRGRAVHRKEKKRERKRKGLFEELNVLFVQGSEVMN